jgi:glucan 1,3-beta-glucosidase
MSLTSPDNPRWIRGVNIGGWLVLERYITPYSFAITDCHVRGDFCWYPGQIDAPSPLDADSMYKPCNMSACNAVVSRNVFGKTDYPMDEFHLSQAFHDNPEIGARWLNYHFDNFVQKEDLIQLKEAGITHVRVPLPHWILGDVQGDEPWIPADRWQYFLRFCGWARDVGLEVWPNIHTAPGSQNGFDNSGIQYSVKTCGAWSENNKNVQRSLDVLLEVSAAIKKENLTDVVTGFGLLNEPFWDCNRFKYKKFLEDGLRIVREQLGPDVSVYMSDLFNAPLFNDGDWGLDPVQYNNTFLDSHYYNIFADEARMLSPKDHVVAVCDPVPGEDIKDCCYEDAPIVNKTPSHGVQRIVTEWSAAYDAMPGEILKIIMKSIYEYGEAPLMDRQLSPERQSFLTKFIQAQIVSYEAADIGFAHGWFFWNFKIEGGAYAEWDFCKSLFSSLVTQYYCLACEFLQILT